MRRPLLPGSWPLFAMLVVFTAASSTRSQQAQPMREVTPPSGPRSSAPTPAPATQPAPATAVQGDPQRNRSPLQAEIYEQLLRGAPRPEPILSAPAQRSIDAPPLLPPARPGLLPEGRILSERVGRLVRGEGVSLFDFTASPPTSEGPGTLEFVPNGLLEALEQESEGGIDEFIISAQVTQYRGRNYLLLLKFRRQVPNGNLSPQ